MEGCKATVSPFETAASGQRRFMAPWFLSDSLLYEIQHFATVRYAFSKGPLQLETEAFEYILNDR